MSRLKKCLEKSLLSDSVKQSIEKQFNTLVKEGIGEMPATVKVLQDYHKSIISQHNSLKTEIENKLQVKIPLQSQPLTQNNVEQGVSAPQNQVPNGEQQQSAQESATIGEEPAGRNDNQNPEQDQQKSDGRPQIRKRQGTSRSQQKIVSPNRNKALEYETYDPYHIAMQYFIGKGFLTPESLKKHVFGKKEDDRNDEEVRGRNYILTKEKGGKSVPEIAHSLWESNGNLNHSAEDYENAIIEVVRDFDYKGDMADKLIEITEGGDERAQMNAWMGFSPEEQEINDALRTLPAEAQEPVQEIIDELEFMDDETIEALAEEKDAFNEWYDAVRSGSKEKYVEVQIKHLKEREDSGYDPDNAAFYKKYFAEQYDRIMAGDVGVKYQKKAAKQGNVQKVIDAIQKAMPKVKVVLDESMEAAGRLDGNTIYINPYYAGTDTPIHEAGHVLIDAIGYNNNVIQKAISQLKDTALWNEIKERYPELDERGLGIEVLAEAIGREGADIFNTESEKSTFRAYLNYIFDWLKRKLGLDKNIAKSLAKQIIGGVGTKKLTGKSNASYSQKQSKFDSYRANVLGRDPEQEKSDLKALRAALKDPELSAEEADDIEAAIAGIYSQIETDRDEYQEHKVISETIEGIVDADDLEGYTLNELIEAYNDIEANSKGFDKEIKDKAKLRIAYYIQQREIERLKSVDKDIENKVNSQDFTWTQVWFKTLSDVSEKFPVLQGLSKEFDDRYLAKVQEANAQKKQLEKLGKAVIREKNKGLGVVSDLIRTDSADYFGFVEQNGALRTSTAGLTKAQADFLTFMQNLVKDRNQLITEDGDIIDNSLIQIDKGFNETYRTEGLLAGLNQYLGGNNNTETEVEYTHPVTGVPTKGSYLEAQKVFLDYGKNNFFSALIGLTKIAYQAKKKGKYGAFELNYQGKLTSKFDKPRPKGKDWSRDYYKAAMKYIDDSAHVKYMADLVPIVKATDLFYEKMGLENGQSYAATRKFLDEWQQEQIYQHQKVTDPILDATFKFLRAITSKIVMAFNVPANVMNVFMGNYNNWRSEGLSMMTKGNARLFGSMKKANAVLSHFDVVNPDYDSNPKAGISKLFDNIAYMGNRWGEVQIQGSMFLGQLSDEEWENIEVKDGQVTIKGDEKAFNEKMIQYRNRVSDIQGKYSEKDRRNFMRFEAGRAAAQFKVWIPDYYKERFGAEFIDKNNIRRKGSWRSVSLAAVKELRDDIKKNGVGHAAKSIWESKEAMANIKGAMTVAVLLIATHGDDDDEKTKRKVLSLENGLQNMLFIIDPHQLKYMLESPIAGIGTLSKFVNVLEDVVKLDADKFEKDAKKVIPYNKLYDQVAALTGEE